MEAPPLKLLDLTLKSSGAIIASVMGEFTQQSSSNTSSSKSKSKTEVAVIRPGGIVEVYSIDIKVKAGEEEDEDPTSAVAAEQQITMTMQCRVETRSVLRTLSVIRLTGNKRDVLAIGSDSGCLSVIDFANSSKPQLLHCPTFGNTGCRRGTPGQYVAADPKGRAVMVAAIEKRKLVYVLNQDSTGKPTIASPLEAHKTRTITYGVVGVDNGYDNPIFAALEVQYPEYVEQDDTDIIREVQGSSVTKGGGDTVRKKKMLWSANDLDKQVAYYELDLGLNHVSRRWASTVHRSACAIAAIPGGADGPSGVLVAGEDFIEYVHETLPNDRKVICAVPRRNSHPTNRSTLITQIVVHRQKRNKFFALCQSDVGDVYKVDVELDAESKEVVMTITVYVMDTLPVAISMNISKLGMLFVASEFGNHYLYQFERIDLQGVAVSYS
ncbi:MAG: mono-functional DNA-alkylating methyl methanesulfonate N-terminal domain-containing protein, partial [bacterium]